MPKKILVVDDGKAILALVRKYLAVCRVIKKEAETQSIPVVIMSGAR